MAMNYGATGQSDMRLSGPGPSGDDVSLGPYDDEDDEYDYLPLPEVDEDFFDDDDDAANNPGRGKEALFIL